MACEGLPSLPLGHRRGRREPRSGPEGPVRSGPTQAHRGPGPRCGQVVFGSAGSPEAIVPRDLPLRAADAEGSVHAR